MRQYCFRNLTLVNIGQSKECQSDCIYIYFAVWGNRRIGRIEKTGFCLIKGLKTHVIEILRLFKVVNL